MIAYINGVEQQGTRSVKFVKKIKDIKISTTKLKNKIPNVLRNLDDLSIKKYDQTPKNIFELMEN
jgi:hypothetical protein